MGGVFTQSDGCTYAGVTEWEHWTLCALLAFRYSFFFISASIFPINSIALSNVCSKNSIDIMSKS